MCLHAAIYERGNLSSYCYEWCVSSHYKCVLILLYVSAYCYVCVLILLCMRPHTAIYASSYCYVCVLILLHMCPHTAIYVSFRGGSQLRPHIAIYVSAYCYICVLQGGLTAKASFKPIGLRPGARPTPLSGIYSNKSLKVLYRCSDAAICAPLAWRSGDASLSLAHSLARSLSLSRTLSLSLARSLSGT